MKGKKWGFNALYNLIFPVGVTAVIVGLWAIFAFTVDEEIVVPKVGSTLKEMGYLLVNGTFYSAFGTTLFRTVIAFLCSFVVAIVFGVLARVFPVIAKIVRPISSFMRALPTVSVILWLALFCEKPGISACVVTALVIFPTLWAGVESALGSIDDDLLQACKIYQIKKSKVLTGFILPVVAPPTISLIGTGISLNLKLMVSAEVLAAAVGSLGALFNKAKINFMAARLMALTIITVAVALLIELIFNLIAKGVGRWRK